jgi:DNA-binding transcriptional regulator YiaG
MPQDTIGQRLKFLMESLDLKVRTFASALDVSETNIRNYISRDSKPSSDIIERIVRQYPHVNTFWLITGDGEPFLSPTHESGQSTSNNQKFFRSPVIGANQGTANQQQYNNSTAESDETKTRLVLAEKEIEHLRAQLAMKDALIESKEETITLLRVSFNRPTPST